MTDRESCNILMGLAVAATLVLSLALTLHNYYQGKKIAQVVQPDPDRQSELDRAYVRKKSTQLLINSASFKVAQYEDKKDWVGANLELTDLVKLLNHRGVIDNEIIAAERARYERLVEAWRRVNEN